MPFSKENRPHTFNGIVLVALFAMSSMYIASQPWNTHLGLSPLILAIVFGIFYGNTLHNHLPKAWSPGIHFCSKRILQLAIILYGFRVSIQQIISVGIEGLLLDIFVVSSTLILGTWMGMKLFKLDRHLSLLISSGSAICGAAAVLATEDVLKSEPYKATIGVITVVLFGTLAMFLYPMAQHAGILGLTDTQFGVFTGASIHEVAQALVAGERVSSKAADIAIIVKMTRVLLLIPVLLFFAAFLTSHRVSGERKKILIPWFAIGFALVIGFNSLNLLPSGIVQGVNQLDIFLLTMAMAAIGMETKLMKIRDVGFKPLYLAAFLFLWLIGSVYGLVRMIN